MRPGESFRLETLDARDAFFAAATAADYARGFPSGRVHPLTGPVGVAGARPGDVLEVEILSAAPRGGGITTVVPGGGLLDDLLDEPCVLFWDLDDDAARCAELPGIRVPGATFPGTVGVAPAPARLGAADAGDAFPPGAVDGLRTLPPYEFGGNLDVRRLTAGSRLYLPVEVPGALLSVGDVHFAQGDGELGGAAIEVAATVTLRCALHRAPARASRFPVLLAPPAAAGRALEFTGLPLTPDGETVADDLRLAARNAVAELVGWLMDRRGLAAGPAYTLASVAADLRICQLVNAPHPTVSATLPLAVFDDLVADPL